jgi:glycosyltransferase involved in cell wall biosynthesis
MIQSLIIEVPKSLILSKANVNGANKISDVLIHLIIKKYADKDIVIVTDASQEDFNVFSRRHADVESLIYTQYSTLGLTLQSRGILPDLGFVSDLKARHLTEFRNYFCYSFPIVSLIHALGSYNDFMLFKGMWEIMGSADMMICPSPSTQETAIKLGAFKNYTHVINYGVDLEKFSPSKNSCEYRAKLGIPLNKLVISLVSRINPYMKMDIMPVLRLLPSIIKDYPDVMLMIVGIVQVPDYVKQLKEWIDKMGLSDHVMWIEHPEQDKIEIYYQASDIFLSLSDNSSETFGLTIIEAMATGIPVVLSNIAGYKVHVEDGKDGLYIPSYSGEVNLDPMFYSHSVAWFGDAFAQSIAVDIPKLRLALCRLLSDAALRKNMGAAARQTVEKRNTYDKMLQEYVTCFESVVKKAQTEGVKVPVNQIDNVSTILGHITSDKLSNETCLRCSDFGRDVAKKDAIFFAFEEHMNRYSYLSHILKVLVEGPEDIYHLQKKLDLDRPTLDLNILYMLKQDLVEVV